MAGLNFDSFESLQAFIKVKEENEFFQMWTAHSRTIESIRKRGIRRPVKDTLKYYELSYKCIFGGSRKSRSTGKRPNQSSCKQGCPFLMRLKASSDGNYLQVVEFVDKHNHVHNKSWIEKKASARGPRRRFQVKKSVIHTSRLTPIEEKIAKIIGLPPTTSAKTSVLPDTSTDEAIYPPEDNFYITQPMVLREEVQPMEQESSDFDQSDSSDASTFESSSITMTDTLMKDLMKINSQQILLNELSKSVQMPPKEIPTLLNSEQMLFRELSKSEQISTKGSIYDNENEDSTVENPTLIKQEPPDEASEAESITVSLSPYPVIMSAVSVSSLRHSSSPITASAAPITSIKPPPLVISVTPVSSTTESPTPVVASATPISSTRVPGIVVSAAPVFSTKEPQLPVTISATPISSAKGQAPSTVSDTSVSLTKDPQTPITISGALVTSTESPAPVIVSADPVESQSPISSPASPQRIPLQALRKRAHNKNKRSAAHKAADVLTAIAEKNCLVLERIATAMEIQATQAVKQTNLIHQMIDLLSKK